MGKNMQAMKKILEQAAAGRLRIFIFVLESVGGCDLGAGSSFCVVAVPF